MSTLLLVIGLTLTSHASQEINAIDDDGKRQGYWKITGSMSPEEGFRDNQLVEEGNYINNRKSGIWKKYYPSGSLRNEITFQNNAPRGPYKIYYPDGKLEEKGNWQGNKNIGPFKRYHPNGKPAQIFNFNAQGNRDGTQNYFYENGNLQLTVEVEDGVANGLYETYYPNGKLKMEKRVHNGVLDENSVRTYEPDRQEYASISMPQPRERILKPEKKEDKQVKAFDQSGSNILYNHKKQVTQVGEFKNGRLWNGKWNKYDLEGNLKKVEVYKEGKFVGYGLPEDVNN